MAIGGSISWMSPPEEEEKHVHQAIDRLQKYTGDPSVPRGWMIGRRSNASQRLYCHAAKERGLEFLYSSDSYGDDLPVGPVVNERRFLD